MPVPSSSVPIRRSLLRDDVHARLRDAIVDCTFAPGEPLRDQDLAAWLGVSRTPVREALLRLGDVGLVQAEPGRSTIVAPIEEAAVRDAQSVVAAMHRLAVAEAVLTADDLARMRAANRRFAKAVRAGDVTAALAADDEFHDIPVQASGNAAVRMVLEQFTPVLRRAERLRFASARAKESVALHDRLVEACATGDPAAAEISHEIWRDLASRKD
ncbi:GntR family transcriptional regulator [Labedaea rhizosphaerae]|uniref:DNA-binding GntR family transcriptional regulator n=1 Tax=Labedaea rhizosphaerae TaxID=598644 RepID=A0A4R6SFY0_LABRH|nr:GntR family transcriptional regulator [Labedaea rhizosphaerae]TDQ00427.1 DNA-binding GntR family transcriptional regulator [Labedaea rhizosphaerae]